MFQNHSSLSMCTRTKTCTHIAIFDTSIRILKDKKAHCILLLLAGGMDPHIKHFSAMHELCSLGQPLLSGTGMIFWRWNNKALPQWKFRAIYIIIFLCPLKLFIKMFCVVLHCAFSTVKCICWWLICIWIWIQPH